MCRRTSMLPVNHYDHSAAASRKTPPSHHDWLTLPLTNMTCPRHQTQHDAQVTTWMGLHPWSSTCADLPYWGFYSCAPPEPLILVSGGGLGLRWQDWLEDFRVFMKGSQVTDPVQQLIALHTLIGKEVGQIIKELPTDTASSYQGVSEALSRNLFHKRNIDSERYSFNLPSQERDESMGEFILRLKRLPRYYAFDMFTAEDVLHLQIIERCQSESLRRRLLKKQYSLDEIEEMTRINNQAGEHAKKMEPGKLEKQIFRLKKCQKKCQSPERQRASKSTQYFQQTGIHHIPDKCVQRVSQLKCHRFGQYSLHTNQCPTLGQQCC
ncbi:hypothetical protein NDU88_001792, partial [Pleurodeles waltl]